MVSNFNKEKMKSIKLIAVILSSSLLFVSCSNKNASEEKTSQDVSVQTEKNYPVRVQKIKNQSIERTLDYTANLIAYKEINYAPASPGRIDKILVEVGNRIKKGQVLVEMDKTQLNQARVQFENAKTNYQRIDTLYKLGSASEQQYEQVKTQYDLAKSSYDYLRENTSLLSPIDGLVTGKYYENGELYSGAPNTAVGKAAIISLMQINPLKAVVSISQSFYPNLKEGMEANITTDIYSGNQFKGKISKVYPTIDASTRTFKVEITIENSSETLRPGMFADIHIKLADAQALVIQSIAVLKQEGTNTRYIFINQNNVAKMVKVQLGKRFDDKIEIISNEIHADTELIIEGQANLMDGSKLNVLR
jgi:RND family efflux transporter MFP subunit